MGKPIRIIPCLDMKDGRVVKGVCFTDLKDAGDPLEAAKAYEAAGADELVMLDITATLEGRKTTLDALRSVAEQLTIPICMGGGFSTLEGIDQALEAGAAKVGINSAAVRDPAFLSAAAEKYPGRIVLAIDVAGSKETGYTVVINGGNTDTGIGLEQWAKQGAELGAAEILLTSKTADGAKSGYDIDATRLCAEVSGIPVIASGGAGCLEDFYQAATQGKAQGLLAASLFHFKELTVGQVKSYLASRGIPVMGVYLPDTSVLKWNKEGLIPVITQDYATGTVLMQAWMNQEALLETAQTGRATYYSRSRQSRWVKGETSGNIQRVRQLTYDCDGDCLLMQVEQTGNACHTGAYTCFSNPMLYLPDNRTSVGGSRILQDVMNVIYDRQENPKQGSYTNYLLEKGADKICKKVGEEASEVIIAAIKGDKKNLRYEAADLLYHLMVLLADQGIRLNDVFSELEHRR